MELINDSFLGQPLRLEGNMAGWQRLYWGGQAVSQLDASPNASGERLHQFTLQSEQGEVDCEVAVDVQWQPLLVSYRLSANGKPAGQSQRTAEDLGRSTPETAAPVKTKIGIAGLASLGFKLLKSAKAFKAILAVGSLAAYSWLFSLPFALALIFCLVVHEYGHIRAMKYFGMKTKGIYLIPFFGGAAVSDSKLNTRWQQVVISIMGPTWGLVLSALRWRTHSQVHHLFHPRHRRLSALLVGRRGWRLLVLFIWSTAAGLFARYWLHRDSC